jgi:hypothetical protein
MRRWLWVMAVGVRVVAAAVLLFGPWTDEVDELEGWDATRFQQIHEAEGRPWVDHPVEYTPGTVVLVELFAQDDAVGTNRVVIVLSLVVDLGVALLLERKLATDVGLTYLLLGTAMVPAGLLRLDLWAAACVALALTLLKKRSNGLAATAFGLAVAVGAAIKIAPVLLIPAAIAARRWRDALAAIGFGGVLMVGWIGYGGMDAVDQVLSLRDVSGWHLESVPGSIEALFDNSSPRREADAFRIGSLDDNIVLLGRILTMSTIIILGWITFDRRARPEAVALVALGSTAALIVTAPLLSPQFLLWLTPLAAVLWPTPARAIVWLTGCTIALTAGTLAAFGPPDLDHPIAAVLLLVRDVLLVVIVLGCARELLKPERARPEDQSTVDLIRFRSG